MAEVQQEQRKDVSTVSPTLSIGAGPNETVEKVHFWHFHRKATLENKEIMDADFSILGFFDSLNNALQLTASSLRAALAFGNC
jgi:hypothetical protein